MKKTTIILSAIIICIVGVVIYKYYIHPTFVWEETFKSKDKQPLGCYVFDNIMKKTLKNGYKVACTNFIEIENDSNYSNYNLFLNTGTLDTSDEQFEPIINMAKKGRNILIAANIITVNSFYDSIFYHSFCINTYCSENEELDTSDDSEKIIWNKQAKNKNRHYNLYNFPKAEWDIDKKLTLWYFDLDNTPKYPYICLARKNEYNNANGKALHTCIAFKVGKGEIIFCSNPYVLTNFGILNNNSRQYAQRMMSTISSKPVLRIEFKNEVFSEIGKNADNISMLSPLSYFLSQKALRMSILMLALAILLLCFFAAKRRQRAIPIVKPQKNTEMEFAYTIGNLYYKKRNNADIVKKRITFAYEMIRKRFFINLADEEERDSAVNAIASITDTDKETIKRRILFAEKAASKEGLSDEDMKRAIDGINLIIKEMKLG